MTQIESNLQKLYPDQWQEVYGRVEKLIQEWKNKPFPSYPWVNNQDILMIAYGDSFQKEGMAPLAALKDFMDDEFGDVIGLIHLLPMFPYSSDDGFSVIDFREINPEYGSWNEIDQLKSRYNLMFDAVVNHVSQHSRYFKGYLQGEKPYDGFFIEADPKLDYSLVTRPRALPLLTPFETSRGTRYVWTTFSDDQIDLNYKNPDLLLEMLDVLLLYAYKGARLIRFDAIGFAWKELGTTCMHLPQVHQLVKLMRAVVQQCAPGCTIVTETNVPHKDNISYFGNGHDEAGMVYQFPLPPLVLYSFLSGDAERLTAWAKSLEQTTNDTTYFNFLASHDGIGMRPVEDLLTPEQRAMMVEQVLARGGEVGYRTLPDGSQAPYELNINYLDAVAADQKTPEDMAQKFLASQCILLSMMGMPAIYYHSLVGSRGDRKGYETSGIKRRINREKLDVKPLAEQLHTEGTLRRYVAEGYKKLLRLRKEKQAFAPNSPQQVLDLGAGVFALVRGWEKDKMLVLVNVTGCSQTLCMPFAGRDLVSGRQMAETITLEPWQYCWIEQG